MTLSQEMMEVKAALKVKKTTQLEEPLILPFEVQFPLELNSHLRDKLHSIVEENWHLRKVISNQELEITNLRKFKTAVEKPVLNLESLINESLNHNKHNTYPLLCSKVSELFKCKRDLTAQLEKMKTQLKHVYKENRNLKKSLEIAQTVSQSASSSTLNSNHNTEFKSEKSNEKFKIDVSGKSNAEIVDSVIHLNRTTSKLMEYRRQSQQLRMELRSALRALCQEVGEGATPQTVLAMTACSSWRGRQQQILGYQNKVLELQAKLNMMDQRMNHQTESFHPIGGGGEGQNQTRTSQDTTEIDNSSGLSVNKYLNDKSALFPVYSNSTVSQRTLIELSLKEKKKNEKAENLAIRLKETQAELKSYQEELKSSKSRNQTLEKQLRSLRIQIDCLEMKLKEKLTLIESNEDELISMRHEAASLRGREQAVIASKEVDILNIQELFNLEKMNKEKLAKLLGEKEAEVKKLESKINCLRTSLKFSQESKENPLEKIGSLECKLNQADRIIVATEDERRSLIKLLEDSKIKVEEERQRHVSTERNLVKAFAVVQKADLCITECLEVARVTDKRLLEEVETTRGLMRELKMGELYSLDHSRTGDNLLKLRTKVNVLSQQNAVLKIHLNRSLAERMQDLRNYSQLAGKSRVEFLKIANP